MNATISILTSSNWEIRQRNNQHKNYDGTDRVCQCRYCQNCSDEGMGIPFTMNGQRFWICMPCLEKILEAKKEIDWKMDCVNEMKDDHFNFILDEYQKEVKDK